MPSLPDYLKMKPPPVDEDDDDNESESNGKEHHYDHLFEWFGVTFRTRSNGQAIAEACPFCGKEKFYLDIQTGQYDCHSENTCGEKGNAYTFINWIHQQWLDMTTDAHYHLLKEKRGLPLQTLKRHKLAWDNAQGCWLIPHISKKGNVVNMTRYYPGTGQKMALPEMELRLYGVDQLSGDTTRTLFVVEGPLDAIALDQHLISKKTRTRYDILAVPGANVFKKGWLKLLEGYTARLCLDNDDAGRKGQERITNLVREKKTACKLFALKWPDDKTLYPEKCDIGDMIREGVNIAQFTNEHCLKVGGSERRILFVRGDEIRKGKTDWLWPFHIPFGKFISLSGDIGWHKSDITKDLAARCTAGLPMPNCTKALPPFNVCFFTSEDSESQVRDLVAIHGGDLTRLFVHDIASSEEPFNLLEQLGEVEAEINSLGARFVVIDALNSFAEGVISSDTQARRTLSGPLAGLARRTGACIIGIRNWGRMKDGTASQKAMGASSLTHISRVAMNAQVLEPHQRWQLEFERVSDAREPEPIPYRVKDMSTGEEDAHLRKLVWEKPIGPVILPGGGTVTPAGAGTSSGGKGRARKGSKKR